MRLAGINTHTTLDTKRLTKFQAEIFTLDTKRLTKFQAEIQSNPYCICQSPNLINYHPQTLLCQQLVDNTNLYDGLINSWLVSKNPYQQSIVDNELIFDKVVLINKEP